MTKRPTGRSGDRVERGGELARQLAALAFTVRVEDIAAPTRLKAPVAAARQVAMYLVHVALGVSLTRIGRLFGRDRSTVAHACQCVEDRRDDPAFDEFIEALERTLLELVERPPAPPASRKALALAA